MAPEPDKRNDRGAAGRPRPQNHPASRAGRPSWPGILLRTGEQRARGKFKVNVILWQTFGQHCISQLTRSTVPDFMIDQLKTMPALFFVAFTAGQTDQEEGDQGMPANDETGRQAVNLPLRTFQPPWATEGSKFLWCALAS
ncbi:hypothetical protein LH452_08085 [Laribacter hongkongensis]|uniref:hypothetical protein n=2 Tax=Laribacter hongkongensis TaxID=168471 RepID=UPI001EFE48B9|nr:hypothetical protein [Laribacter hongkongensis]MCG9058905.1 hypothetical protein [Laribacter hongkongensis]MCG9085030.1 hypothetical protein [Laribacter hongkongensis]